MRSASIKFNQTASERIYLDYMKRVKRVTRSLSKENQEDISMELNSHIFEAIRQKNSDNEVDSLLDVLEKIGAPEEVLKPLVADKQLEQATRTFNPVHIFKALLLNITNGISYIIFLLLYLFLFSFVFLIFAKLWNPGKVGFYYSDPSSFIFGISNNPDRPEILGNWFIPAMLLAIAFFYIIITFLLKLKKYINRR